MSQRPTTCYNNAIGNIVHRLYNCCTTALFLAYIRQIRGMNVITIRDYARQHGVSYEAVRKQVVQYRKELNDHIIMQGRKQYLDDEAVRILDEHRKKSAVSVVVEDRSIRMQELEEENRRLMTEIARLQTEGNVFRDQIIQLLTEKQSYLEDKGRISLMLEQHEQQEKELKTALKELSENKERTAQMQAENDSLNNKLEEQAAEKASLQDRLEKAKSAADQAEHEAEDLKRQLLEAQARAERLKNRGFWARLTNREV